MGSGSTALNCRRPLFWAYRAVFRKPSLAFLVLLCYSFQLNVMASAVASVSLSDMDAGAMHFSTQRGAITSTVYTFVSLFAL